MSIVVTLSPELEILLHGRAAQRGQDLDMIVSELLTNALEWEKNDSAETIQGIQRGLDDFENGRFRSFQDFAEEQRSKYNLEANP